MPQCISHPSNFLPFKCEFMSHVNEWGVDLGPVEDWPFPREHSVIGLWSFQGPRSSPRFNRRHQMRPRHLINFSPYLNTVSPNITLSTNSFKQSLTGNNTMPVTQSISLKEYHPCALNHAPHLQNSFLTELKCYQFPWYNYF